MRDIPIFDATTPSLPVLSGTLAIMMVQLCPCIALPSHKPSRLQTWNATTMALGPVFTCESHGSVLRTPVGVMCLLALFCATMFSTRARLPFLAKESEWNVTTRYSTKTTPHILLPCVLRRRSHSGFFIFYRQEPHGERRFNVSLPRRSAFRNNLCRTPSHLSLSREDSAAHRLRATTLERAHPFLTQLP
jgi:hypothetical protein